MGRGGGDRHTQRRCVCGQGAGGRRGEVGGRAMKSVAISSSS